MESNQTLVCYSFKFYTTNIIAYFVGRNTCRLSILWLKEWAWDKPRPKYICSWSTVCSSCGSSTNWSRYMLPPHVWWVVLCYLKQWNFAVSFCRETAWILAGRIPLDLLNQQLILMVPSPSTHFLIWWAEIAHRILFPSLNRDFNKITLYTMGSFHCIRFPCCSFNALYF